MNKRNQMNMQVDIDVLPGKQMSLVTASAGTYGFMVALRVRGRV